MIREFILCRSPGDLSSAAALPGKQLLCATAPGARGGPEGTWLFLVELSCQPMGLGLPGWVHSRAWGWNSWGGGDLLLERGFHPGSGTCPMEDAAGQLSPGTRYGLALFPGRAGRGRGHGQTNPGAHLTRGECPLGRKKQLCGQKSKKRTRARQCKERSSCVFMLVQRRPFAGAGSVLPSWTQELQGGSGEQRSVLVIQPETEQMWERKIRAG